MPGGSRVVAASPAEEGCINMVKDRNSWRLERALLLVKSCEAIAQHDRSPRNLRRLETARRIQSRVAASMFRSQKGGVACA